MFGRLPAELATFTGRDHELTRLFETAARRHGSGSTRTVVISAIEGMGVGKTQLAVRVAHELVRAGHFTDVQPHVNLTWDGKRIGTRELPHGGRFHAVDARVSLLRTSRSHPGARRGHPDGSGPAVRYA